MKIIVCGAGSVGRSIVAYLSRGSNDIIVIDTDSHKLDEISKEWDIQPINGSASHPDVLERRRPQRRYDYRRHRPRRGQSGYLSGGAFVV